MKGRDFVGQLKLASERELEGDIKLVYKRDISPSMFPGTRLEVISNTYQFYKFTSLKIDYTPQIPDVINGMYLAFFDTDPEQKLEVFTKETLLRAAQSHQYAVQGKANKKWSVICPINNSDDMFYTGNTGEIRFRKQATLYIFQVGSATGFEAVPLKESLDSGLLNISWTINYQNPQMNEMSRIYDGVSQKDMLRVFKNLVNYAPISVTGIGASAKVGSSRFRVSKLPIPKFWFNGGGQGSYMVVRLPNGTTSIPNTVKAIHSLSLPYSKSKYSKSLNEITVNVTGRIEEFLQFVEEAFKITAGGIQVAKEIYDVATTIAGLFVAGTTLGSSSLVTYSDGTGAGNEAFVPRGTNVIYYDGINTPLVEDYIEFEDEQHAGDLTVNISYNTTIMLFKLDDSLDGEIVEPNLPKIASPP